MHGQTNGNNDHVQSKITMSDATDRMSISRSESLQSNLSQRADYKTPSPDNAIGDLRSSDSSDNCDKAEIAALQKRRQAPRSTSLTVADATLIRKQKLSPTVHGAHTMRWRHLFSNRNNSSVDTDGMDDDNYEGADSNNNADSRRNSNGAISLSSLASSFRRTSGNSASFRQVDVFSNSAKFDEIDEATNAPIVSASTNSLFSKNDDNDSTTVMVPLEQKDDCSPTPSRKAIIRRHRGSDHSTNDAEKGRARSLTESRRFSIAAALGGSFKTVGSVGAQLSSRRTSRKQKLEKKSRLVQKSGDCNIYSWNVPKRDRQFMRDIFTTLIDCQWRYILATFSITFLLSWTGFAILYSIVITVNGQWVEPNRNNTTVLMKGKDYDIHSYPASVVAKRCIINVYSVLDAFLFSIEAQHTIGFGYRYISSECISAIVIMCIQCICGLLIQSFMVGLVFAKMARPKKRGETLMFSENAVISQRDGQLCFLFRCGDMRDSHLVEAHIRLQMIRQRFTEEGEIEPLSQVEMSVGENGNDDRLFLVWPYTVCHVIDKNSPLFEVSKSSLLSEQFEIIVLLEGIVESTGMTVQARTSYLPKEIYWGRRFEKLVTYQKKNDDGCYRVDYSVFNSTYEVDTPMCSARVLDERREHRCDSGNERDMLYNKNYNDTALTETKSFDCTPLPSPLPTTRNSLMTAHSSFRARSPSNPEGLRNNPQRQCFSSDTAINQSAAVRSKATSLGRHLNVSRAQPNTSLATPLIIVDSPSSPSISLQRESFDYYDSVSPPSMPTYDTMPNGYVVGNGILPQNGARPMTLPLTGNDYTLLPNNYCTQISVQSLTDSSSGRTPLSDVAEEASEPCSPTDIVVMRE